MTSLFLCSLTLIGSFTFIESKGDAKWHRDEDKCNADKPGYNIIEEQSMVGHVFEDVKKITDFLLSKTTYRPTIGVICGSGLGGLVDNVEDKFSIDYSDIPGFPLSTVAGHAGKLVFGKLSGRTIVCLQGRFHYYEGHSMHKCSLPV